MRTEQYEREKACFRIDGYYIPRPNETSAAAFERAKVELLRNLRQDIEAAEAITPAIFEDYKR